ncbi:MAG: TolC family protein [Myxococcota bacterium]
MRTVTFLIGVLPGLALADQAVFVTRAQLVREALERNAEVRAGREQIGFSEADLLEASRLLISNPTVDGEYGSDALFAREGERRAGAGVSQEFEIGFQRGLRKERAGLKLEEARARLRDLELRVARDASDAYFALWRADRLRALARNAREVNLSLERAAESRFRAGDIAELERNVVEVDVARAEAAAAAAEAEWLRAQAEVNRLTGRPIETELQLAEEPLPPLPATEVTALLEAASEHRADLVAARLAEDAAAAEVSLRYRELIPNPTFSVAYEVENAFIDSLADVDRLVFAKLSFPIPLWDRKQGEIRRAKAARGVAAAEREGVERLVATEVRSALGFAQGAKRALDAYEATLPRVERNLTLLEQAYQAGQVDLSELLAAKDRAFATRREHIEALASYGRSVDELLRATGRLPTEAFP